MNSQIYQMTQKSFTHSQYNGSAKPPAEATETNLPNKIHPKDVKITYSTSSGPGGQNVNKVATKVDIRQENIPQ